MVEEIEETANDDEEEEEEEESAATEGEGGGVESSLEELLAKRSTEAEPVDEEPEDDAILSVGREERVETLSIKVVPQQPTEFTCRKCFLVRHRSQLADKRRMYCRDCA